MIVVIQCAATKKADAGHLRNREGRTVRFVARPEFAPADGTLWARPDDPADAPNTTWRDRVEEVNATRSNPCQLLEAWKLYAHPIYERLVGTFGIAGVRILSAGWGLVRADFLLPAYDITFSTQADEFKRRRTSDHYRDFAHVEGPVPGPLVFVGGKDYLAWFERLTSKGPIERIAYQRCDPADRSARDERVGAVVLRPFRTRARTNWHYACAEMLCSARSELSRGPA